MKDLTQIQLKTLEQLATNAGTVVLGTLILGRFLAFPENFVSVSFLIPLLVGIILYVGLCWFVMNVSGRRKLEA